MYESGILKIVGMGNSAAIIAGGALAGPAVAVPNAYMGVLISLADASGRPRPVSMADFNESTVEIDARFLDLTSKILTAMALTGAAMGVAISTPLVITMAVAAASIGALADPKIRDMITDPDFWDKSLRTVSSFLGNTPDPPVKTTKVVPFVDPLILDLDGDGLEITPLAGIDSIKFDTDSDGVKTATAYIGSDFFLRQHNVRKC